MLYMHAAIFLTPFFFTIYIISCRVSRHLNDTVLDSDSLWLAEDTSLFSQREVASQEEKVQLTDNYINVCYKV